MTRRRGPRRRLRPERAARTRRRGDAMLVAPASELRSCGRRFLLRVGLTGTRSESGAGAAPAEPGGLPSSGWGYHPGEEAWSRRRARAVGRLGIGGDDSVGVANGLGLVIRRTGPAIEPG